jgi:hypothetical protein
MPFLDYSPDSHLPSAKNSFWLYLAVAIPLTLIVLMAYGFFQFYTEWKHREDKKFQAGTNDPSKHAWLGGVVPLRAVWLGSSLRQESKGHLRSSFLSIDISCWANSGNRILNRRGGSQHALPGTLFEPVIPLRQCFASQTPHSMYTSLSSSDLYDRDAVTSVRGISPSPAHSHSQALLHSPPYKYRIPKV